MSGTLRLYLQIDSLDPWMLDFQFNIDMTTRLGTSPQVSKALDLAQTVAEFLGSEVFDLVPTYLINLLCSSNPYPAPYCNGTTGVTVDSAASLLVTSPTGKEIGTSSGSLLNDIPGAWYSGVNSNPQIVIITNPEQGTYQVTLTGKVSGQLTYGLASFSNGKMVETHYASSVSSGEVLQSSFSISSGGSMTAVPLTEQQSTGVLGLDLTVITSAVITAVI